MIIGYDGGNKKLELAFSTEEMKLIEEKLEEKKRLGVIRGWSSFIIDDMRWCQSVSMSEALSNMDETAYNATKDLVDLDEAVAFYGDWT